MLVLRGSATSHVLMRCYWVQQYRSWYNYPRSLLKILSDIMTQRWCIKYSCLPAIEKKQLSYNHTLSTIPRKTNVGHFNQELPLNRSSRAGWVIMKYWITRDCVCKRYKGLLLHPSLMCAKVNVIHLDFEAREQHWHTTITHVQSHFLNHLSKQYCFLIWLERRVSQGVRYCFFWACSKPNSKIASINLSSAYLRLQDLWYEFDLKVLVMINWKAIRMRMLCELIFKVS